MATPVRLGLIGVGRWGTAYLQTLSSLADRCRLTHLATNRPENARLVAHPVTVVADWRDLVRAEACDAVIIATPSDTHPQILEACLEAGKPCMVEKPVCVDVATAQRLHQRAEATRVPVFVNYIHLFGPAYRALKRAIAEEGAPIRVMLSEGMGLGPFRAETPALWDWGPHDIALALDLMARAPLHPPSPEAPPLGGEEGEARVASERFRPTGARKSTTDLPVGLHVAALGGPSDPHGQPELVSVRLDFSNEATAWIHAGRLSPSKRRSISVFTDERLYHLDDVGSPSLTVSPFDFSQREVDDVTAALKRRPLEVTSTLTPLAAALCYFFDGLAGGDRDYFGLERTVDITRVLAKCEALMHASMGV